MKKLEKIYLVIALVIVPLLMNAQAPGFDPDAGGDPPVVVGSAPIGGGAWVLVILALVYGSTKYVASKKKKIE